MTCYAQRPLITPNFIALGQTMYEKSVTIFYTLQSFDAKGDPLGHSSPILALMYSNAPSINLLNFVPFRYLLPNFVDFFDGVTDKKQ